MHTTVLGAVLPAHPPPHHPHTHLSPAQVLLLGDLRESCPGLLLSATVGPAATLPGQCTRSSQEREGAECSTGEPAVLLGGKTGCFTSHRETAPAASGGS